MKIVSKGFVPRTEFPPHTVPLASFAAHHRRALAELKSLSRQADLVLELRDARAPLTSINPLVQQALPGIPRLTLYTKWELSTVKKTHLEPLHPDNMYRMMSMDERKYSSRLLKECIGMAEGMKPFPPLGFKVLVTGMPNAGKSSLINKFREILLGKKAKRVAVTGAMPGVTRAVSEKILISTAPKIYAYDTPGVMMPQVRNWEHMLKLCLIGAVPRRTVDPIVLADYLLFKLNQTYPKGGRYPGKCSNDIESVLWNLAGTMRRKPSRDTWDPSRTAMEWVDRYIRGGIGKLNLDDLSIDTVEKELEAQQASAYDLNALLPLGASNLSKRRSHIL